MIPYGFLGLAGPDDLIVSQNCLTLVVENPLNSSLLNCIHKVLIALSDNSFESLYHFSLEINQPYFYVEPSADGRRQLYLFFFRTEQSLNRSGSHWIDKQRTNSFEELAYVLLNDDHIVGIGKNLHQLVVADKVKPGKKTSFYLEVVLELLFYLLEQLKVLSEVGKTHILDQSSDQRLGLGLFGQGF